MLAAAVAQHKFLDVPTLVFVTCCIVGFLGSMLLTVWLQQREVRALAWWGSAYLIGAGAIALWGAPTPRIKLTPEIPEAMLFIACGMIWSGVRLFHGRKMWPLAAFAGAVVWLLLCQFDGLETGTQARIGLGALVIACYGFAIAFEMSRERRRSFYSTTAAIVVPSIYASMFLVPLALRAFAPEFFAAHWVSVFAIGTIVYAMGTASS